MDTLPKIGVFVLESLTTGMYNNPLDALREYIQNSTDSIFMAEEEGIIKQNAGRIDIFINPTKRTLKIRDNGIGIGKSNAQSRLLNIGMSEKDLGKSAGFRGIGRLAGIAYCKTIKFRTCSTDSLENTLISLDCENIRNVLKTTSSKNEELVSIIIKNCCIENEKSNAGEHFFEVELDGITDAGEKFLSWQDVESYLSQNAPVKFDAHRFAYGSFIKEWETKQGIKTPVVTIMIRTPNIEREVFKPYKNNYCTKFGRGGNSTFLVKGIKFFPEDISSKSKYWIWWGDTSLAGMVEDESVSGFRLRSKNIAIGGADRISEIFGASAKSDSRFNNYYIGEINVLADDLIPNARRDGFEDQGSWGQIKKELIDFVKERVKDIRSASINRNFSTEKISEDIKQITKETQNRIKTGFISKEQKSALIERIDKAREKVDSVLKSKEGTIDEQILESYRQQLFEDIKDIDEKGSFTEKKLRTDLTKEQRKIVSDILEILLGLLETETYKKAEEAILSRYQSPEREEKQ